MERGGNISASQKTELIEFMGKHPELQNGKFTQTFTFKHARKMWEELTNNLNAVPGATKDWKKWRKTWHDMKAATKSKKSSIKRYTQCTGGGPSINTQLNTDDEKILDIIGPVAVEGQNVEESLVEFDDSDIIVEYSEAPETVNISETKNNSNNENPQQKPIVPSVILNNNKENSKPTEQPKLNGSKIPSRKRRIQRLEHTITATEKLSQQTERKILLKEEYYINKLQLYQEEVDAKKRIADALESIAAHFKTKEMDKHHLQDVCDI
ncbi:unnamed protein product [Brassicogethes aeneus]|uniref:Regulatory protein zeste n=1 Tax=Brassicogethes aeneus TaxID=1431903 RepID=A0A9P0FLD0_BRAAE|nr:unnamed protein product [Brassicogethes aeneus]